MRHVIQWVGILGLLMGWPIAGIAGEIELSVLQVGDLVPQFCCQDDKGKIWDSQDRIGKGLLVVYFYRGDFCRCSTRQAESYRDRIDDLVCLGADVVGVSGDSIETHQRFKSTHHLNFPLLADTEGAIARQFGVPVRAGGKSISRGVNGQVITSTRAFTAEAWTFIVGEDGRILYRETTISPAKDSQEVLEFISNLNP